MVASLLLLLLLAPTPPQANQPQWFAEAAELVAGETPPTTGTNILMSSGCTVPTAENFNATAEFDDGSCICDGSPCDPASVQLPQSVCPSGSLTCMTCDSDSQSCNYECVSETGEECSSVMIQTSIFAKMEVSSPERKHTGHLIMAILTVGSELRVHSQQRRCRTKAIAGLSISHNVSANMSAT